MKVLPYFFIFMILAPLAGKTQNKTSAIDSSAVPEVEWYPPEIERIPKSSRAKVILSGKTQAHSLIQVQGENINLIRDKNSKKPKSELDYEVLADPDVKANNEGYFETLVEMPTGQAQIPIRVVTPQQTEKTFLISVDVSPKKEIKINAPISFKKPPAASKKIRLWIGAGFTYQNYSQGFSNRSDLGFSTLQSPGLLARAGYWGDTWGFDFYFRDAPGKINAEPRTSTPETVYHWRTIEAKGLYQFKRGPTSRLFGLPSQWQLRFGAQSHQIPFLLDSGTAVTVETANLTTATLGSALLLGQEKTWSYEFGFGVQYPLSAKGPGEGFKIKSPMGIELQLGVGYKFRPNWRFGAFSYTQYHSASYETFSSGVLQTGSQKIQSTTLDLRIGYEY